VPTRPLLLVAALAGGDYLLWTWSSDGGSATVALISGLALAPLILALIWLVSVTVGRALIGRAGGREASSKSWHAKGRRGAARLSAGRRRQLAQARRLSEEGWEPGEGTPAGSERRSSEKIAA
jgi:hypothetical protein